MNIIVLRKIVSMHRNIAKRAIQSFLPYIPEFPFDATDDAHLRPILDVECKGSMDFCRGNEINAPLLVAAQYNNVNMIKRLLGEGYGINQQNILGETALMHAARENKKKAVLALLRHGAQSDVTNYEEMRAEDLTLDADISALIQRFSTTQGLACRDACGEDGVEESLS